MTQDFINEIVQLTGHHPDELASFDLVDVRDEESCSYFEPTTHQDVIYTLKG